MKTIATAVLLSLLAITPKAHADTYQIDALATFGNAGVFEHFDTTFDWDTVGNNLVPNSLSFQANGPLAEFSFLSARTGKLEMPIVDWSNGTQLIQLNMGLNWADFTQHHSINELELVGDGWADQGTQWPGQPTSFITSTLVDTPEPSVGETLLLGLLSTLAFALGFKIFNRRREQQ